MNRSGLNRSGRRHSPIRRSEKRGFGLIFGVLILVVLAAQVVTIGRPALHQHLLSSFGSSWRDLAEFRFVRLATSSLIQASGGLQPSIILLVGAAAAVAWYRLEGRRAVALWFAADAIASIVLFSCFRLLAAAGSNGASDLLATRDAGSSSGAHAVITAGLLTLPRPQQRIAAVGALVAAQVPLLIVTGKPAFVHHVIAVLATVGLSFLADRVTPAPIAPARTAMSCGDLSTASDPTP